MGKVLNMTFASSLTSLCEINSSFDTGILRICYTGNNRNGSYISRDALERSIKTLYNCPIVCNYDREAGCIGGHDMEIVRDETGGLRITNLTQPVGVIPESSKVWFDNFEEADGTIHEYLYAEVLLWKRQEAYRKIKESGITAHSMEITVKDGELIDGVYHINDFEFTAFALIGVEPCFESSALEMFAQADFKQQFSEMICDLRKTFATVTTSEEDDNTITKQTLTKGGEQALEEKMALAAQYGIDVDSLDFSILDFTVEELTEKFEAMKSGFAMASNILDELCRKLSGEKIADEWGEYSRYVYVDCDMDAKEVYCWDCKDWLLYGFSYDLDGDSVVIDFGSRKRKKYVIVDFDEGEQPSPFAPMFELMADKVNQLVGYESRFNAATDTIAAMEPELAELRQFKSDVETAAEMNRREEVLNQFEDLSGIEAFEKLRADCMKYDVETLEEKCFAIRGRNGKSAKFNMEQRSPKLKVTKSTNSYEPYGGLFEKYANSGS